MVEVMEDIRWAYKEEDIMDDIIGSLNKLGDEGWECISKQWVEVHCREGGFGYWQVFLKRSYII